MAVDKLNSQIRESAPTVTAPHATRAALERRGYVPGIPLGGATSTNPGQNTTGALDRTAWMDQLFQAYLACGWASDCIDAIAATCTAGGLQVVPVNLSLENPEIPDPPPEVIKVQSLLSMINPYEDSRQLMRDVIVDLLIFGDSYTEVKWFMNEPAALYPLDPRTMEIMADEHGKILGYHQKMETGREVTFAPREVVHVKLDSPGGGLYGVSPTQKNILNITIWLFIMALNQETFKNGDPLRAWVDWPLALPDTEMRRFQQMYQIRNKGAKNIGNLVETKGGAVLKELGINQIESWAMSLTQRRDEIISGYGVPPSKVGVVESANIGGGQGTSQDRTFRINTCGPLSELVLEKFSFALLYQAYGITNWVLQFGEVDWRDDQVLEQIRDMRVRNGSWTLNRYRTDIGEPSVIGGDDPILVDRQNLVLWKDISELSKANVSAIEAKGQTSTGGTGTLPPTSPAAPSAPKGPTANEAEVTLDAEYNVNGSRIYENLGANAVQEQLEREWTAYRQSYRQV